VRRSRSACSNNPAIRLCSDKSGMGSDTDSMSSCEMLGYAKILYQPCWIKVFQPVNAKMLNQALQTAATTAKWFTNVRRSRKSINSILRG